MCKVRVHVVGKVFQSEPNCRNAGPDKIGQIWVLTQTLQSSHRDYVGVRLRGWGATGKQCLLKSCDLPLH